MRAAIYYAPHHADPLWKAAAAWLGRDAETAAACPQPALPDIAELTASPRRYGFHATLKPPMRLATDYASLRAAAGDLAAATDPFPLPPLSVQDLGGFLALRETRPCPPLQDLAARCVTALDPHRAPPTAEEHASRRAAHLSPEQSAMLDRWGYPHVLETWFFHMTLTRRLSPREHDVIRPAAERHFAAALALPRRVEDICIFTEAAPGAPFLLAERFPLGGG